MHMQRKHTRKTTPVTVRLTGEMIRCIDDRAKKGYRSRSQEIQMVLEIALFQTLNPDDEFPDLKHPPRQ